jgi:glycosyltransferase involved in cell wall biosynthesis
MKIAIVHDWLITYAGSERVLEQILEIYPKADLFSLIDFIPEGKRGFIKNKTVKTSFMQKLPYAKSKYRNYFFLAPIAIEQFDFSGYDIVISSSHCAAKGIITGPDQFHISYIYSPARYVWDLKDQYLKEAKLDKGIKGFFIKYLLHKFRLWEVSSSVRVDKYITLSNYIARRINKVYKRKAEIIYPPVNLDKYCFEKTKRIESDYFVTFSRFVPYKKIDLIAKAFVKNDLPLKIIGTGPDLKKIKGVIGNSKNVELLGFQEDSELIKILYKAKAFIFAAEEDYGIAPLEAQALGVPVIAYGKGGALETINGVFVGDIVKKENKKSGIFFKQQTEDNIVEAVNYFIDNQNAFAPVDCVENANRFSPELFRKQFKEFVEKSYNEFKKINQI